MKLVKSFYFECELSERLLSCFHVIKICSKRNGLISQCFLFIYGTVFFILKKSVGFDKRKEITKRKEKRLQFCFLFFGHSLVFVLPVLLSLQLKWFHPSVH